MDDLPPGVTRYRLGGYRYRRVGGGDLLVLGLLVVGVMAFAIWGLGSDPGVVALIVGVCALVAPATVVVPWLVGRVVVIGAVNVAVMSWVGGAGFYGYGYALSWFAGAVTGMVLLLGLGYRRWRRQRLAMAEGAPPSGRDPSNGRDVGVFAMWRDAEFDYEAADPSLEVVLGAVRALNGADRSSVSVFHGLGRLDVGGDAGGRLVVLQSDNRNAWHMVEDSSQLEDKEPVVFHGFPTRYPRRRTVALPAAERAVTTWLQQGERDPGLDWWSDTGLNPAFRPRTLTFTD